ncbi:putative S-adenosyl-L-methionine-dependent methyltransferase [Rhizocola hellebori]|uniref:S-adenosyl-L-methionine-dependent methyltransferase n=1 Tax=Rhizocola hellebori TaxID=1392758 RepID=A0A8J3VIJ8_9ACTN|nr:SAM-dependent methyltransferase [Rhizocola hellebori]GIH07675.1 putative S-adenosyl-L-methionine-dependent methyltransferase [Rhizocola hellebori]
MSEPVRSTNDWMAAVRAAENRLSTPYLTDPWAQRLTGPEPERVLNLLREQHSPIDIVLVRGRFGDELLAEALDSGVRQIVSLAAGTDARGWRLDLGAATFYEIDLPGQLAGKHAALGTPRNRVLALDADLRTDWVPTLVQAGHRADEPTVWIIEGLFYYLSDDDADRLLGEVSAQSAPGSMLCLDIPDPALLSDPELREFLDYCIDRGSPFIGSNADPEGWLRAHGWQAEAYLPDQLDKCEWLPDVPKRLRTYHDVWHVAARR